MGSGEELVDQQCLNKTEDRGPYPVETDSAGNDIRDIYRQQREQKQHIFGAALLTLHGVILHLHGQNL